MPRERKFRPGRWVYWWLDRRPKHRSFIESMQFRALQDARRRGVIRRAIPNQEQPT